ncbi:hypothetical protein [Pseudovibrio sp. Tun.PSC04-5.I4]|uniref:hypothetical protein n=1 Tax=Pseudovibrio sp. Tun.PSC04-5.I4 TaxID=1798213 RepID=UPI000887F708|nr:hypothetical protein [Pseudovibrio sp. Tun.PSC04-5.I4]SDQ36879.1 hypothetical protein SAMN04515695_0996 [Pseudovibrio sp. Tun.PSC04-5.I4]SDR45074.1 hypothetical protein SAMN04515695_5499 [Pseudovibrio sp. Tun.PSC04-5.I4]
MKTGKKKIEIGRGNRESTAAFNIYLPKSVIADIKERADKMKWRYGHYVAYVYENVSHPDPSKMTAIDELKKINHDQARLGNLLNSGLADAATKANHEEMEKLLRDIRDTQAALKAKVRAL